MALPNESSARNAAAGVLGALAVALVFLLPIKFASINCVPERPEAFPGGFLELAFFHWPPAMFTAVSSLFLLGTVCFTPPPVRGWRDARFAIALAWTLLMVSTLPGFANSDVMDYAFSQLSNMAGLAAFALALRGIIAARPDIKPWIVGAVVLSTVLVALMGLNQYLSGFQETLKYMREREAVYGISIPAALDSRLRETRVFATFSICNSLAAHLLLTVPVCLWAIWSRVGVLKGVVAVLGFSAIYAVTSFPVSQILFMPAMALSVGTVVLVFARFPEKHRGTLAVVVLIPVACLLLFIFGATRSRGAFVAAALTALLALAVFIVGKTKPSAKVVGVVSVATLIPVAFSVYGVLSRGANSMWVRFDYFNAAWKLFLKHPLVGAGWGGFLQGYQILKHWRGTETPHTPHNFILNFASQAGLLGLLAAIAVLLLPFILAWKRKPVGEPVDDIPEEASDSLPAWVVLAGWCAWSLHSLADFNIQVSGTVATGIALLMCLDWNPDGSGLEDEAPSRMAVWAWRSIALAVAVVALTVSSHRMKFDSAQALLLDATNQNLLTAGTKPPITDLELDTLLKSSADAAPYSPFPWLAAGHHFMWQGRWAKAEFHLKEALKRAAKRSGLYHDLFIVEKHLGKNREALEYLKKAAVLSPNAYADKLAREQSGYR